MKTKHDDNGNMALEITLLLAIVAACFIFIPVLIPQYNSGVGLPTGEADLSWINAWTIGGMQTAFGNLGASPSALDYARLALDLLISALIGVALILLTIIFAFPALVLIFHIPVSVAAVLQVGIYFCYIIFWLQVKKGGVSWDQYR